MTVSYTANVANASGNFGCFTKILFRWKGSVYKLIFKELLAYVCCFFMINLLYRVVLCHPGYEMERNFFEALVAYCKIQISSIPMTFGLGFYVTLIVKRWWEQYTFLPWPDSMAILVSGNLRGTDERSRIMRRTIMRYILLAYVITLRRISYRVLKRFPTLDHLVEAGLMRADELKAIESMNERSTVSKWWMPLTWAAGIIDLARQENKIGSDPGTQNLMSELSDIRRGLTVIQHYDTISVPLVYTQVVTLAVYTYFAAAIFGSQWIAPINGDDYELMTKIPAFASPIPIDSLTNSTLKTEDLGGNPEYQALDLYVPIYLIMKFVFYVGWLKVAETLINPFGEDDDDFEVNYLIDRHMQVSYMIVDLHSDFPNLEKDAFWSKGNKIELPYTEETEQYRKEEPKGSAEVQEEHDGESSTYYKLAYVLGSAGVRHHNHHHRKGSRKVSGTEDGASEYESIDASNLLDRMKAKIRKSQMRRPHNQASSPEDGNSSLYYANGRRKSSTEAKFNGRMRRSTHSNRSIYAKMFGSKLWNKSTRSKKSLHGSSSENLAEHEHVNKKNSSEQEAKNKPEVGLNTLYGKLADIEANRKHDERKDSYDEDDFDEEEEDHEGNLTEAEQAIMKRHLSRLTTITENSPESTQISSRRSSRPYITAEHVFASPPTPTAMPEVIEEKPHLEKRPGENESNSYYPLGSDGSNNRPMSPRFHVEEVPNYEPVLFSPKPPQIPPSRSSEHVPMLKPKSSPNLAREVMTKELAKKAWQVVDSRTPTNCRTPRGQSPGSPELPKRQPVMAMDSLRDENDLSRESSPSSISGIQLKFENEDDHENSTEKDDKEIKIEKDEESQNRPGGADAQSAFDQATYYV